jgi:pectate lyase
VEVTSHVDDDEEGSLRRFLEHQEYSGRSLHITFKKDLNGKVIQLGSLLRIQDRNNIIVDGSEGSPVIAGSILIKRASGIMLEYLTVVGNANAGDDNAKVVLQAPEKKRDVLEIFDSERVVVDHCTFLNGSDELVSTRMSDMVLICNSVIAYPNSVEGQNDRRGSILGGRCERSYIACHNNVYAQCDNRAPRFMAGNVFFQHNVIYNNRLENTATVVATTELDPALAIFKRNLVFAKPDTGSNTKLVYIYGSDADTANPDQLVYVSENTIIRSPAPDGEEQEVLFEAVDNRSIVVVKEGSDDFLLTDDLALVGNKCRTAWLICLAVAKFKQINKKSSVRHWMRRLRLASRVMDLGAHDPRTAPAPDAAGMSKTFFEDRMKLAGNCMVRSEVNTRPLADIKSSRDYEPPSGTNTLSLDTENNIHLNDFPPLDEDTLDTLRGKQKKVHDMLYTGSRGSFQKLLSILYHSQGTEQDAARLLRVAFSSSEES